MVLSELEETCDERGWLQVSSVAECKASTGYFQIYYPSYVFSAEEDEGDYPKGCYVYTKYNDNKGYFNTHDTGASGSHSRALCTITRGKKSKKL